MTKKYVLKPGRHQFVPGAQALHDNENLSDENAKWYMDKYPHIASMFELMPTERNANVDEQNTACRVSAEDQTQSIGVIKKT